MFIPPPLLHTIRWYHWVLSVVFALGVAILFTAFGTR